MYYLEWLLSHPNIPLPVIEMMKLGKSGNAQRGVREKIAGSRSTGFFVSHPALDLSTKRALDKRIELLEGELIPRLEHELQAAQERGAQAMANEYASDLKNVKHELEQLVYWLNTNSSIFGRSTDLNVDNRNAPRTTTYKNLNCLYAKFRKDGLNAIADHLDRDLNYRYWEWIYEPRDFEWIVEIDL